MGAVNNLFLGWLLVSVGFLAGAAPGLFFWQESWLGGYGSWRRRLIRLAHISFFGLGFINIIFALSLRASVPVRHPAMLDWASLLIALGAVAMPLVCYLSAWRMPFRQLFVVPVICMVLGVAALILSGALP
jgi:hypothetical protein